MSELCVEDWGWRDGLGSALIGLGALLAVLVHTVIYRAGEYGYLLPVWSVATEQSRMLVSEDIRIFNPPVNYHGNAALNPVTRQVQGARSAWGQYSKRVLIGNLKGIQTSTSRTRGFQTLIGKPNDFRRVWRLLHHQSVQLIRPFESHDFLDPSLVVGIGDIVPRMAIHAVGNRDVQGRGSFQNSEWILEYRNRAREHLEG